VPEREELSRLRHDLRAPLTVVIGFAEILAAERPLSEEQRRDYSERVLNAATQMRALIDSARL
jgi:signal transduction histidine kinase